MKDDAPSPASEIARRSRYVPGLSAKLLLLTILFVMVAEVLVFVPSVSNFRRQWLMERLAAAQIASLAAEAAPGGQLPSMLRDELLEKAKVKAIAVKRADARVLIIEMDMPTDIDASYDLRDASWLTLIADALMVYMAPDDRIIRVVGEPGMSEGEIIDVVMGEGPLKAAMIRYGLDILGLSILISIITAALVYLSLDALLVKPMTKLTWNIVRFSERPEDPTRVIAPSSRRDEIGTAERELSAMQKELAETLTQKSRLAALGLAVSKISHDLRNMLSSAQLLSDRLITVKDPTVQRLVPKLIASLDRAIRLCARTLDFGQAQETPPRRKRFPLAPLVSEIGDSLGLPRANRIDWTVEVDDAIEVDADRDQLYRVLSNLCRNAVQALEGEGEGVGEIMVVARREGAVTVIEVADTGPGLPEKAREHLFEAFQSVARKGGTGLGLAIAAELVKAHGGQIALVKNEGGAAFRVTIPDVVVELERARLRRA
ncbi:MAG TPA: HAMP domain-containing sensor histidine kinase [Methyloceanibacter sp.]|nr:HAMP domain-containing sensor histidine kinase [Methyloceanibacter sp.]